VVLGIVVFGSLLLAYNFRLRIHLFNAAADIWVVDDGRVAADAVVVFGEGRNTRPFAAAEAYNDGLAPLVLLPDLLLQPIETMGLRKPEAEIHRQVVLNAGVPESAIQFYGHQVSTTWEEAQAIKAWCEANQVKTILCPTGFSYGRRLRWVLDQVLEDTGITAHVSLVDSLDDTKRNWWTNEYGLIDFQNELAKYLFYRVKY
jgi:uncharacterized SAM-binding protein YcdF (DUF218 family)